MLLYASVHVDRLHAKPLLAVACFARSTFSCIGNVRVVHGNVGIILFKLSSLKVQACDSLQSSVPNRAIDLLSSLSTPNHDVQRSFLLALLQLTAGGTRALPIFPACMSIPAAVHPSGYAREHILR